MLNKKSRACLQKARELLQQGENQVFIGGLVKDGEEIIRRLLLIFPWKTIIVHGIDDVWTQQGFVWNFPVKLKYGVQQPNTVFEKLSHLTKIN